jgi:AraC-like DNA-binding protein
MSPVSLPLASHRRFASDDFEAMHTELSSVLKPHQLRRLSAAPVSGIIYRAPLGRIWLNVLRIGPAVDVAPGTLEDFFLVQVPIQGTVELGLGHQQIRCERAMAAVISPGERLRLRWSDNCTQLIVQIPRIAMEGCLAERLGFVSKIALKFRPAFDLDQPAGREWRQLLDFVVRVVENGGTFAHDPISGDLEDLLLSALLTTQPHNHVHELEQRGDPAPFYVLRAEREMRGRLGRPFTMTELADAAGVSERTLYEGFRRFRATTPMRRLAMLRLEAARGLLRNAEPGTTVARVAAQMGFLQFGRFAGVYRAAFGERPSETLRAGKRRRALRVTSGSAAHRPAS